MSKNWNQPVCESCWIERNSEWEETKSGDQMLVAIRQPVMVTDRRLEQCCHCGGPTIVGIYVRIDPDDVNYPAVR